MSSPAEGDVREYASAWGNAIREGGQKSGQKSGQKGGQKGDFTDTLQKLYRNLTDTDRKIVELIESDKFVTTSKMAEQIGKSRQTIATRIKDLQEKGIVRRNGPDNGGYWEFLK